jgi:hypothetical protein
VQGEPHKGNSNRREHHPAADQPHIPRAYAAGTWAGARQQLTRQRRRERRR